MMKNNKLRLRLQKQELRPRTLLVYHMLLSLIEILAYFPKLQNTTRYTWKSPAAR